MANPGYGKRSAPAQLPRTEHDFAHLPPREASIAAYIDRLQDAGHLRRGSECVAHDEVLLWVTRTFFSRTARDDDWWAAFSRGDAPPERRQQHPTRSRAFVLLAALGRTAPALTLSAADCAALEPQVTAWFERGATEAELLHALTDGLPAPIHHAAALVRRRLTDKMPPERTAPTHHRTVLRTLECGECRAPGSAEVLIGGRCGPCRGNPVGTPTGPAGTIPPTGVRSRMNDVRAAMKPRSERIGRPPHPRLHDREVSETGSHLGVV
ncbi:hypothetical protein ACFC0C_25525 [Streptomyces sp. NPDC056178]|uniref:hypothetical protein n=1 Tax=Streptomyces sp. NPDC056178 TaxID=3345735 RepID=UPI0035DF5F9C